MNKNKNIEFKLNREMIILRKERSHLESFLRSRIKKRRRKYRKNRVRISWKVKVVYLTGLWGYLFPQAGLETNMKWCTEDLKDIKRPGLEAAQGMEKGTLALDNFWRLASEWEPSAKLEIMTRSRTMNIPNKLRNRRMREVNGNSFRKVLTVVHWNTGNKFWQRKREMVEACIQEKNPDIIFISEANMMSTVPEEQRQIGGYKMVLPNTMDSLGYARLILLVRLDIDFKVITKLMGPTSACIWIKVGAPGRKPLKIGGFYRELSLLKQGTPNLSNDPNRQLARWNTLLEGWKAAAAGDAPCLIIGDINLDYLKWDQPEFHVARMVERTKLEIETLGFSQLVRSFMRTWPDQDDSCVDHIWTNCQDRVAGHTNMIRSGSDHNVITVLMRMKDRILCRQEILKRSRKDMCNRRAQESMRNVEWGDLYGSNDINVINSILETKILEVLDREAPLKVCQIRKNYRKWVSKELKDMMNDRDKLRERARTTGDRENWQAYRTKRNKVSKETKKCKDKYFKEIFSKLEGENDTKKIFGTTKDLLGWQRDGGPRSFLVNGEIIRKPIDLANHQLDYFAGKMNTLKEKIRRNIGRVKDPLERLRKAREKWTGKSNVKEFNFRKVSLLETFNLVKKLGNSLSFGHEGIDANFLKLILPSIANPLRHLINVSLSESVFANRWKVARVFPLLKDKDLNRLTPASFRPVSLLPTISKVVEMAAQQQLLEFMETSGQLNRSGHAYRKFLSTTTTVAEIADNLYQATEDRMIT